MIAVLSGIPDAFCSWRNSRRYTVGCAKVDHCEIENRERNNRRMFGLEAMTDHD